MAGLNSGAPIPSLDRAKEIEDPEAGPPCRAASSGAVVELGGAALRAPGRARYRRGRRTHRGAGPQARLLDHHHRGGDPAALHRHHQRPRGAAGARDRRGRGAHRGARRALPRSVAIFALVSVFALLSVALLPLSYAAFSMFLTPTFVLLAEASTGDWHLAGVRILNTVLGGGLALAGNQLLWPSPESERLPAHLAQTIARASQLSRRSWSSDSTTGANDASRALREARRQVAGSRSSTPRSRSSACSGSAAGRPKPLAPAMTLLTYTRRFTASIAAFALSRYSVDAIQAEALAPFAKAVDAALADVAAALAAGRAPAPLGELPELPSGTESPLLRGRLTRLGRQLKTLHDAAARWVEPSVIPSGARDLVGTSSNPGYGEVPRSARDDGVRPGCLAPDTSLASLTPRTTRLGQVSEWLKEPVSKTGKGATPSRVRIPPCPLLVLLNCSPRHSCRYPSLARRYAWSAHPSEQAMSGRPPRATPEWVG